ncbi:MAG: PP2C family protein-serine/threonine phosphatase, partial [Thermodesulfobacteriota bacterium]
STGIYTTFFAIFFDLKKGTLECAGAAHPPVIHCKSDCGEVELLSSKTSFLGMQNPLLTGCVAHRRKLASGDRVILYTDGLTEARDSDSRFFGTEGIVRFAKHFRTLGGADFNTALIDEVFSINNGKVSDDILVMTITIK